MQTYWAKTPATVQRMFPKRIWRLPNRSGEVFLTFDDGPIPKVTPWVLDTLQEFNAKGTFFCIGDNVQKHPDVFRRIQTEGHRVGNHTFHHRNGKDTDTKSYLENTLQAEKLISQPSPRLFRPPYGRLRQSQSKALLRMGYGIVMWDVLSGDFDTNLSKEQCLQNVLDHIRPGSIVVFHDSLKAEERLVYALPRVLEFISEKGWKCSPMD